MNTPSSAAASSSELDHAVWYGLGLEQPAEGSAGAALASVGATALTVAADWSAAAAALARRRRTPLLVIDALDGSAAARMAEPVPAGDRPWPVLAITQSPWVARSADFGLLVGRRGPADHDGLGPATAVDLVRRFLALCDDGPPASPTPSPSLLEMVPFDIDEPYAVEAVLAATLDDGAWVEFDRGAADEVLTAVGRIDGRSVGVVASRPSSRQGTLDGRGCARVERLVGWCERGGLPVIFVVDSAGLDPASKPRAAEAAATVRAADVLKLTVVLGRAVGLAATVLGAVGARADLVLPWPRARFALDPIDGRPEADGAAAVLRAAREGDVFDIIHPDDTRARLVELLEVLRGSREYRS